MPGMTGTEFLARVKQVISTARRGLLISWLDRSAAAPILEAAALGWLEFYLPKPAWSPDEQFHRAVTESLEEWWREQGGRFEAVTVIGQESPAPTRSATFCPAPASRSAITPAIHRKAARRWNGWAWASRPGRWWRCTTALFWWNRGMPR
jgi:CheY-like chemotaxis protein